MGYAALKNATGSLVLKRRFAREHKVQEYHLGKKKQLYSVALRA